MQIQSLCDCLSETEVRHRLGSLPKDLVETYDDIYNRNMTELRKISSQHERDAKKVFHLLLSSHRSWNPVDMANMLEPATNRSLRTADKVLALTFHFITHDKELDVLRFAHLSVREYFETHLSEYSQSRNRECHVMACIDYLEATADFKFRPLTYPSASWCDKVLGISERPLSAELAGRLVGFLIDDTRALDSWSKEMLEENKSVSLRWKSCGVDYLLSDQSCSIMVACALGLEDILDRLLKSDPTCMNARNRRGQSPLLVASEGGHKSIVTILVQSGVNVNERVGHHGELTALGAVISANPPPIAVVRQLLELGADPNSLHTTSYSKAKTVLQIAAGRTASDLVGLLLEYGASPNLPSDDPKATPLYNAVYAASYDNVMALLEGGATVQPTDGIPNEALYAAVKYGRSDIAMALVRAGADIDLRVAGETHRGWAPLPQDWLVERYRKSTHIC